MTKTEKFTVSGDQIVEKVKQIIRAGNARGVRLVHKKKVLFEIPLTVGVPVAALGIVWAPVLAAIGACAALCTKCTIEVEKAAPKTK